MDIALLLTGNELMSGDTIDSNSAMMAQSLGQMGFDIDCKVTIGDQLDFLVEELDRLSGKYQLLIVNGGLGPTIDDLTAEAFARLTGRDLVEHPEALAHVNSWCADRGIVVNDANYKQAVLPQGCAIIANARGSAVGFRLKHNDCVILATPGVPSELRTMVESEIIPYLGSTFPAATARFVRRLKLFGIGESGLQQVLSDQFSEWPDAVGVGFRAGAPLLELKLVVESERDIVLRDQCEKQLHDAIGDFIIGENDETMAQVVVEMLSRQNRKLALAESCTGGLIASSITSVSGASNVFEAGVVSYSNAVKTSHLGVDASLFPIEGAVSEAVVRNMAMGAMAHSGADCAIAVSGVAGPGGGSEEKPVGTVWIAWGSADRLQAHRFYYPVGRELFQTMVTALSLDLLRRFLQGNTAIPAYFQREVSSRGARNS